MRHFRRRSGRPAGVAPRAALLGILLASAPLTGCAPDDAPGSPTAITVWRHTGTPAEDRTFAEQVEAFNRAQAGREDAVRVNVRSVAEGDYDDTVRAAGAAHTMPDVVEVDGPNVPAYAYADLLTPLDGLVPEAVLADQLPSLQAQNAWRGETYAVGVFDSGLGLYADRSALEEAGVRVPDGAADAWTAEEFGDVLSRLARDDDDGLVLDVKRGYGRGEWLTYGFAPLVASAGGALLGPDGSARGHLDAAPTAAALEGLRSWSRYVDPDTDGAAFTEGRVALSWVGHWLHHTYREALGDDLVVLPLPDLGVGAKTGQGSWAWGVSAPEERRAAAGTFLAFLLERDEVLRMARANSAVPGTRAALAESSLYGADGPLRLFADQLVAGCGSGVPDRSCVAVPRPQTPGYPVLTNAFAAAVDLALRGEDPRPALREAARIYDEDRAASADWR